MRTVTLSLEPKPPYDFDLTAGYMTFFRGGYAADAFENGVFERLLELDGQLVLAEVRSAGTSDSPLLEVRLRGRGLTEPSISEARCQVAWMLGTHDDLDPFYAMAGADPRLASLVDMLWGLHPPHTPSVYESLVHAILGQQISSHVALMLRNLLTETYGESAQIDGKTYRAFPRPDALAAAGIDGLRAVKLSARKAEYVLDVASKIAAGELDLEGLRAKPAEEAIEALTRIRGVGQWTAQWLAIRALGHPDGFPHGDLALQRHLGALVDRGLPMSAGEALEYSARWSPRRSYVTVYLFAAARMGRLDEMRIASSPSMGED